ncbi:hypothetical protein EDD66_1189 [Mobilisporobacter senegalensis]|uniref:Uncharacterized protein n=1 Tax=Mobilisporobacter senegalensis TaxID=1329262 RepID=A0A3N1X562_9FIRM|nr:hypothetical protein EDD66_1189 [Mobilisporobacter senegalensis]
MHILSFLGLKEVKKVNFNNKKTQKIISTIIIIVLVLAMLIPTVLSAVVGLF